MTMKSSFFRRTNNYHHHHLLLIITTLSCSLCLLTLCSRSSSLEMSTTWSKLKSSLIRERRGALHQLHHRKLLQEEANSDQDEEDLLRSSSSSSSLLVVAQNTTTSFPSVTTIVAPTIPTITAQPCEEATTTQKHDGTMVVLPQQAAGDRTGTIVPFCVCTNDYPNVQITKILDLKFLVGPHVALVPAIKSGIPANHKNVMDYGCFLPTEGISGNKHCCRVDTIFPNKYLQPQEKSLQFVTATANGSVQVRVVVQPPSGAITSSSSTIIMLNNNPSAATTTTTETTTITSRQTFASEFLVHSWSPSSLSSSPAKQVDSAGTNAKSSAAPTASSSTNNMIITSAATIIVLSLLMTTTTTTTTICVQ